MASSGFAQALALSGFCCYAYGENGLVEVSAIEKLSKLIEEQMSRDKTSEEGFVAKMLTRDEFVRNIKVQTSDSAVRSVLSALKTPPGRVPNDSDVRLARWFTTLSDRDRAAVSEVIREAAEHAIFGLFAILDGERVFEYSADKGNLELYYVKGKQRILLNPPNAEELHNVYNRLCQEDYVVQGRKPNRRGPRSKATK